MHDVFEVDGDRGGEAADDNFVVDGGVGGWLDGGADGVGGGEDGRGEGDEESWGWWWGG